jgi:multidrug efflux pump subunit AcrA (membrane-fusion protein)
VEFLTRTAENVLKVANAALRFRPEGVARTERGAALYFAGSDGKLQRARVRTGITDGSTTEVRGDAIKEGMKVIAGTATGQSAQSESSNPFQGNSSQQRRRPGGF